MKRSSAGWLALAIVFLLISNSAPFFFRHPFYEWGDWAADSFSIERAKHFAEEYGNYSRWGFHHPGPAFLYVQAFGEWLFYDTLHLVPAPYNGQVLAHLVLMVAFYVATLRAFMSWLPSHARPRFLCAALGMGAVHFAFMSSLSPEMAHVLVGPSAFLSIWNAHALVLPFLCLLTAGSSVAAGRAKDLPLLTVACGFLVHGHVAQPLFVIPLFLLAYTGLWSRLRVGHDPDPGSGRFPRLRSWLIPIRMYPREHWIASGVLVLFILPILLDLAKGADSNLAAIIKHLSLHRGEHKTLISSLLYFLQYGGYATYEPGNSIFGSYNAIGFLSYLRAHLLLYLGWTLVAVLALQQAARGAWTWLRLRGNEAPETELSITTDDFRRFLAWCGWFLIVAFFLTLIWGTIQDGDLFYYNAWFNFSIYYFALLCALATASCVPFLSTGKESVISRLVMVSLVLLVCVLFADRLRVKDPNADAGAAMHAEVQRAETADPGNKSSPVARLLVFTPEAWPYAASVALQLHRAGYPVWVTPQWQTMFGQEYVDPLSAGNGAMIWRVDTLDSLRQQARDGNHVYALRDGWGLLISKPPSISGGPTELPLEFHSGGNAAPFELYGWGAPEDWGSWNVGHRAALTFHPLGQVKNGMGIALVSMPLLAPKLGLKSQQMRTFFNGVAIGDNRITDDATPVTLTLPAAVWNKASVAPVDEAARLEFEFPDAVAPASLDATKVNKDQRLLAVGFRRIQLTETLASPHAPSERDQAKQ